MPAKPDAGWRGYDSSMTRPLAAIAFLAPSRAMVGRAVAVAAAVKAKKPLLV
jgi:hypothetical protein